MQTFDKLNPLAITIYIFLVAGIAMFSMNPILLVISLLGVLAYYFVRNGSKDGKRHLFLFLLFVILTLINPLISHNGVTVLFVVNNNPITLEALIYGMFAAIMIVAIFYWFSIFSQIMTSEKLLYIFGAFSPKLALILSMTLRYVPMFTRQVKKVNTTQKALGMYKEDNIIDSIKGGIRIFSIMVTWALENGIITADSMTARGYGIGKRSQFSIFRFCPKDICFLVISIILFCLTLFGLQQSHFSYYPSFLISKITGRGLLGYISYALLVFLPIIVEGKGALQWKYLKSKI